VRALRPHARLALAVAALGALAALAACQPPAPGRAEPQLVRAGRALLGATVTVSITARDRSQAEPAARAALGALGEARRVEDAATAAGPLLAQVRRTAGRGTVQLPEDLFRLTSQALRVAALTGGAYDPTAGAVRELFEGGRAPAPAALRARLPLVGWKQVQLTPQPPGFVGTVALGHTGARLDLEELWRPYAVDRAAQHLAEAGLTDFLVEAGGVAAGRGAGPHGPWRVGVADPAREGEWAARLFLKGGALAVVGAAGASRVDPRTGQPQPGLDAVAVLGPDALTAAAVGEAVMALGPREGAALVDRLGLRAVYCAPPGATVSAGLRDEAILRAAR
jgi:thiamine biosynthesis lipoprotein